MARRDDYRRRLDTSAELRKWFRQVIVPTVAVGAWYFSENPDKYNAACQKGEEIINKVKNKLHLNKKNED